MCVVLMASVCGAAWGGATENARLMMWGGVGC